MKTVFYDSDDHTHLHPGLMPGFKGSDVVNSRYPNRLIQCSALPCLGECHGVAGNRAWAHWHRNSDDEHGGPPISYKELVRRTGIEFQPGVRLR